MERHAYMDMDIMMYQKLTLGDASLQVRLRALRSFTYKRTCIFMAFISCEIGDITVRGQTTELRKFFANLAKQDPGRKVKQEQEETSRNHVPRLFLGSVQ